MLPVNGTQPELYSGATWNISSLGSPLAAFFKSYIGCKKQSCRCSEEFKHGLVSSM